MKLSVVFWALLHLAAEVCASTRASPWQMVMWYYTYRLHVAVVGLGVQAFAPCISSSGTYCSFDEFAQYVQRTSKNYPVTQWTIGTVDGRGLGDLPDPLKAVQAIQANLGERVYSVQQAPTKLFPAKYTDPKANYRFDDMIKSLDANIVYLRQIILQHTSVDIDAWDGTSDMWKGFVTSVEGHKEMREADEWDKELSNVKNGFTQAGHTPFTKTVTSSVDGRTTWTELDPVQILPNSGMNGASYIHLVDTSKSAQSASHTRMATQFTVFQQLPLELRLKIWQFSIPADHVTELDAPYPTRQESLPHWLSNKRLCDMRNASRRNGGPPAVGRVCREARQVVQENGCYLDKKLHPSQANDTFNKIRGQWFQHEDVIHLNWDLKYDSVTAIEDEPTPVPSLTACAQFAKSVSITNELLLSETFSNGLERNYRGKPFLRQRWAQNLQLLGSLKECFVCLMSFNIHAPAQIVAGKHLFDNPIRLASPFDHDTLERMHHLWEDGLPFIGHGMGDGESETMFREILNRDAFQHKVHIWNEDVCDLWLFYRYTESWASIQGPKKLLWEPPADLEIFDPARINFKGLHWNKSHPWVMAELDAMPKFKPVIMFRHCTKNCFDITPYLRPSVPGFPPTMGPPLRLTATPGYFDFRPMGPQRPPIMSSFEYYVDTGAIALTHRDHFPSQDQ